MLTHTRTVAAAELKFARAQAEADLGDVTAERNQLQTLTSAFKGALTRTGTAGKVVPAVLEGGDKMLKRLWEAL